MGSHPLLRGASPAFSPAPFMSRLSSLTLQYTVNAASGSGSCVQMSSVRICHRQSPPVRALGIRQLSPPLGNRPLRGSATQLFLRGHLWSEKSQANPVSRCLGWTEAVWPACDRVMGSPLGGAHAWISWPEISRLHEGMNEWMIQ